MNNNLGKVRRRYKGYAAAEVQKRKLVLYASAALVVVLMIMLAVWGIGTVVTEIIAPDKVTATAPRDAKEMTDDDAIVVLTFKLSDDNKQVEHMVLSRFDPIDSRVYVMGLSPRVIQDGKTLGEYFVDGGTTAVTEAVARLVDCDKVFSITMNYTTLRKVVNIFGGVTLTIPYAIKYDSPNNDRNLNVAPGTREYTGWEVARLLNYPDWNGGEEEQLYMYAMVTGRIINENMYYEDADRLKKVLTGIYEEADSDITMTDFQRKSAGLLYLCSVNRQLSEDTDLAVVVEIWPDELPDGSLEYTGDDRDILLAAFGRRSPAED